MQTINNRMTENQIADLFSLAVQLQVKAEESDDRDTAILAYSIQNACSNLTESQREFRAADATIHNLELKLTDMAVQLANAESKCRDLAGVVAENAALKAAAKETLAHWAAAEAGKMEMMMDKCMPALRDAYCKTPATDTFLAEVRAQGVEMFADSLRVVGGHEHPYSVVANEFAAQLRKGSAL